MGNPSGAALGRKFSCCSSEGARAVDALKVAGFRA